MLFSDYQVFLGVPHWQSSFLKLGPYLYNCSQIDHFLRNFLLLLIMYFVGFHVNFTSQIELDFKDISIHNTTLVSCRARALAGGQYCNRGSSYFLLIKQETKAVVYISFAVYYFTIKQKNTGAFCTGTYKLWQGKHTTYCILDGNFECRYNKINSDWMLFRTKPFLYTIYEAKMIGRSFFLGRSFSSKWLFSNWP